MTPYLESRPSLVSDTECYVNYWSIGFKAPDGRERLFELYDGHPLDKRAIASIFRQYTVYTFNGIKYDIPMILYAMSGATNAELKQASDELIQYGTPWWVFMERLGLSIPDFMDHVDLMSVSPGAPQMPSLKIYAGRLHSRKMQELPIAIDERIGDSERQVIRAYHGNDLDVTSDLKADLKAQLELRVLMSKEYGVDLRSKSDAQIAEAVIKSEIAKATGKGVYAPDIPEGYFSYEAPAFIRFHTQLLRGVLHNIKGTKFLVKPNGVVEMPDYMKNLKIEIGNSVYKMGIGGLHSTESRVSHYSDDEYVLLDRDVTSYYPMIILLCELYPKHIGPLFLKVYKRIFDRRLAAKKGGDKNTAETLKIVLNGSFGKFGSPYSALYGPRLLIQTTVTGQLSLLMLIEELEHCGFEVVSANTDGIVTRVPRERRDEFNAICFDWELQTGFTTEETEYLSLHSRDVNNYIALKKGKDGKIEVKTKGTFAASGPGLPGAAGQKKNPDMDICNEAVVEFLKRGEPIEDTIEWCHDPRKFITVRRVTGGALKDDEPIGKALRWYYSKEVTGGFLMAKSGNAVPKTIGAKLMMELQPAVPSDIDYDYYIRESYAILQDLGVSVDDPKLRGRNGRMYARLPDAKGIHVIDVATGVAICGKTRESIRDSWVEYKGMPDGHRLCGKCKKAM
jgi:hypothetical protein